MRFVLLAAATALLLVPVSVGLASLHSGEASTPVFHYEGGKFQTKPSSFYNFAGTGWLSATQIRWSSWGGAVAVGKGTLLENVGGADTKYVRSSATFTLSRIGSCSNKSVYTLLSVQSSALDKGSRFDLRALGAFSTCPRATPSGTLKGTGFKMPSGLVTCAYLSVKPAGLYCGAGYIKKSQYDGEGVNYLPPSGKARYAGAGNDLLLYLGGWRPSGGSEARPVLPYGSMWSRAGFTCKSATTGVDCRRGSNGFHLSKQSIRLF